LKKTSNTKKLENWVDTVLEMMRVRNCAMTFFAVLLGASFINFNTMFGYKVLLAGSAAFIVTGAGNIINDYFDYEIDRINRPKRPLPSGKIKRGDAMMLSLVLFMLGLGISKYVNDFCLGIAIMNSIVLLLYGKYSKKMYIVSNLTVAYLVASVFVYGALANLEAEGFDLVKFNLLAIVSLCAFFATLAREVMKDIEDIHGDIKKYAVTLPIRLGVKKARKIASSFIYIAIFLSAVPFLLHLGSFNIIAYGLFIFLSDVVFISSLKMHPALSQRFMVAGMVLAIVAFFVGEFFILS